MSKIFKSIGDVSTYIKDKVFDEILNEVSSETESVMKKVTKTQVSGDTGDMINCIGESERSNDSVTVAWQDNGSWFSLHADTYGKHMYAPWALENGKTFAIGMPMFSGYYHEKTTLKDTTTKEMKRESIEIARKILNKNGFKA